MANRTKRLRIFAGPNGSGKSTLYEYLVKIQAFHSYFHINPDSIAKDLPISLNLNNWPVDFSETETSRFLDNSPYQAMVPFRLSERITIHDRIARLKKEADSADMSYLAAAVADCLRCKMMRADSSFSFESVFSHPSKIKEIEEAGQRGFKIYLYFITTADPRINRQRVKNRAERGGHDVPEAKIRERYFRTMSNCYEAFLLADRVFFFDNSFFSDSVTYRFFAEKRSNKIYVSNSSAMPQWFDEYILRKIIP
jgi:predicted ABC-type ATPase